MKESIVYSIFPEAVIYVSKIDVDNNKILEYAKQTVFEKTTGGVGCYLSHTKVFDDIYFIKDAIKEQVEFYIRKIMHFKMDFKFLNSWISKTEPKGYSETHIHRNTFISGVYYPEASDEFSISFIKDYETFWDVKVDEINNFNAKTHTLKIKEENMLILFPSNLKHKIDVNNSSQNRYSVAFNINPSGYIGGKDGRVFF
jgi:uncharacterized protein (TIGR02466 family)